LSEVGWPGGRDGKRAALGLVAVEATKSGQGWSTLGHSSDGMREGQKEVATCRKVSPEVHGHSISKQRHHKSGFNLRGEELVH